MATADPTRTRALACLREGLKNDQSWRPVHVLANVRSSRPGVAPYRVRFAAGQWSCTCDKTTEHQLCPHASAVALVTMSTVAA